MYVHVFFTLETLENEVEAFVSEVQQLEKIARQLVSQGHFDTANINSRQVYIKCCIGTWNTYVRTYHSSEII